MRRAPDAIGAEGRKVPLPDGRTLSIRFVERGDVDGLAALYAELDPASNYRRFFSAFQPRRPFFEHMATIGERGGAGLVATVGTDHAGDRIVAECGYEVLPNGNGELAITVDRAWRGWLGAYLLDALVDVAASRGVPNLEADILVTNGPMLALLRSRGDAIVPSADWNIVRAVIGTATRAPVWPGPHLRLRLLVEGAGGRWHGAGAAEKAGLELLGCPGPAARRCPAVAGEACPLAAGADVIVVSFPPDDERWSELRAAHPRLHPGVPICVELAGGRPASGEVALPAGSGRDVIAVVERLGRRDGPEPGAP